MTGGSPVTLGDLERERRELRMWCNVCGHQAVRDPLTLGLLYGRSRPVGGLWRSLRCTECGASGADQGAVFSMPTAAPPEPMGLSRPG